jgi:hypothetical protein
MSQLLHLFIRKVMKYCGNYQGILLLLNKYQILSKILHSSLAPYAKELLRIISVGFDAADR